MRKDRTPPLSPLIRGFLTEAPSFPPRTNRGPWFYPESSTLPILLQTPTSPANLQMFMLYGVQCSQTSSALFFTSKVSRQASVSSVGCVEAAIQVFTAGMLFSPSLCLTPDYVVPLGRRLSGHLGTSAGELVYRQIAFTPGTLPR
ncbi:uncharacterized protein BDZ83DRAFT_730026 [Colletotrichum acutatum]|uniref:Uncharacterized protein n=1 Tax=Glomerella acutata TaxID=27357 RepID=A0AAD8XFH4_GLOAC|nr:uncharacterized protein BDZ83DRAFT_730026 [Colletotrichum acutatum]KAK1725894.1 hypothetical protein BDZ83DRAFT_730026 [Colletotrichum acutatum]